MVREARLEETEAGLVPRSFGWFVANVRDLRWSERPGMGRSCALTGRDEYEAETFFPTLGMSVKVVPPGEPSTTYRWETEQEDFLVLAGEGIAGLPSEDRATVSEP